MELLFKYYVLKWVYGESANSEPIKGLKEDL